MKGGTKRDNESSTIMAAIALSRSTPLTYETSSDQECFSSESESEEEFLSEEWKTELQHLKDLPKEDNDPPPEISECKNVKRDLAQPVEPPQKGAIDRCGQIVTLVENFIFLFLTLVAVSEVARYFGSILFRYAVQTLSSF
jgi:hypothetical protein